MTRSNSNVALTPLTVSRLLIAAIVGVPAICLLGFLFFSLSAYESFRKAVGKDLLKRAVEYFRKF